MLFKKIYYNFICYKIKDSRSNIIYRNFVYILFYNKKKLKFFLKTYLVDNLF